MRFLSPFAAVAAVSLSVSAPAYAHPKLVSSTPAANARVSAPSRITLTFSEGLMARLSGAEIVMTGMPGMPNHRMAVTGFKTAVEGAFAHSPFAEIAKRNLQMLEVAAQAFQTPVVPITPAATPASKDDEIAALKAELTRLQDKVEKLG